MNAEFFMLDDGLTAHEKQIAEVSTAVEKYRHFGVMAERERCARIAEERASRMAGDWSAGSSVAAAIAKEIRDGI